MRRLDLSQLVSVNMPIRFRHDDVLDFRVVAVIDRVVALEPLDSSDTDRIPDQVRDCCITFGHRRGLVGLKGHLYQRTPGDWRFKVTDPVSFPTQTGFRIRICLPITLAPYLEQDAERALNTKTVNFGADGVLVDAGSDWPAPERVRLTLSLLGKDEPIEAPAVLVARKGGLCDYRYEAMNTDARNRLCCFIIECQRYVLTPR